MTETIVLGGGCFWCTDAVFRGIRGVLSCECGYANGNLANPSYEAVCRGDSGHNEVVRLDYDPALISTDTLLGVFFACHDPTTRNRQGNDVGTQYRSGIYVTTPAQEEIAKQVMARLAADFPAPLTTEIAPLQHYFRAEDYHQNYFARNPQAGYCSVVIAPKLSKLRAHLGTLMT